jgi:hypothetical protein
MFSLILLSGASPVSIVVPNFFENVEGDSNLTSAFSTDVFSQRYQQVFAASQFTALTEPMLLTEITFRPEGRILGDGPVSGTISDIEIRFSTTSAEPDGLSATFSENVGPDDSVVFKGSLTLSSANVGNPGPKPFDLSIPLQDPFLYDPTVGNLLMDVRNFSGGHVTRMDATGSPTTSRVFSAQRTGNVHSLSGTPSSEGLIARFTFVAVPRPPLVRLMPDSEVLEPGRVHTVTSLVTDADGIPISGVGVRFEVVAGPNAGVGNDGGECAPLTDCTTDHAGQISFSYSGVGGAGVDEIVASIINDDAGVIESNRALQFWDVDCNENAVADTCDVDCGGFSGACADAPACGGSNDHDGDGVPDECNHSPDCRMANAEPYEIWPSNGEFRRILVAGVTDEDEDTVMVTITSITQDEPVTGRGLGDTTPDGSGVGTSMAQVRAERLARGGDGRVYHIGFSSHDGRGGQCEGTISVCVPHDRRRTSTCVDQGPLFDSTGGM